MTLLNLLIVMLLGDVLGKLNRFHGFLCKLLYIHKSNFLSVGSCFSTLANRVLILFDIIVPLNPPFVNMNL